MTSSIPRYQTPDCLFCSDSATNTQADFAVDLSYYATNWETVSTTGVRFTDTIDRFRYLTTRKTIDVRFAAYAGTSTGRLYHLQTSGASTRQSWRFSGSGLMEFIIDLSTVSTYQIANWTSGDIITATWTMEPNPFTTSASDEVRSEVHIFNETAGTYEYHSFSHAEMSAVGAGAGHSFWSVYGGTLAYTGTRYMCRLSSAFHSATECYETLVGALPGSLWFRRDNDSGGNPLSARFRVFSGSYLTITPGTAVEGFDASPNRYPGPWCYQEFTGDFDARARIALTDSSGTGDPSGSFIYTVLYAAENTGPTNWFETGIGIGSTAPTVRRIASSANSAGTLTTHVATSTSALIADLRITRAAEVITLYWREHDDLVELSDDTGWTTQATIDRTATPLAATLNVGPMIRTNTSTNGLLVAYEIHGFETNSFGETPENDSIVERKELPVPTTASGAGDDGEFGGPIYALAARSLQESLALGWGPVVNEVVKGSSYLDDADDETNSWAWIPDGHEGHRIYGEYLYRRPVPPDAAKLYVRLHVQTDRTLGQALEIGLRVYSMSQPGPYHRPSTSPPDSLFYYANTTLSADHGTTETAGEWVTFPLIPIARDNLGYTYIAIGINHPDGNDTQSTRIRAIQVIPVTETDTDSPFGIPGGFSG